MQPVRDFPLKNYNTFGVNACAAYFMEVTDPEAMGSLARQQQYYPVLVLGGGSNILFLDNYPGLVVKISTKGIVVVGEDRDHVLVSAAAGEDWDGFVGYCVSHGWGGLENLSGIPGQVGSSPIQNIGAYGAELKDHFVSLDAIELDTGKRMTFNSGECRFGYRDSIFKRELKGRVIITQVTFRLDKTPRINLSYKALRDYLGNFSPEGVMLQQVRAAVLAIRASKLPDPAITGNAGSFFKNPVVSPVELQDLKEKFPEIVYFESVPESGTGSQPDATNKGRQEQGTVNYKLAAGWMIDRCGWKGYREGDAGVHADQALVLVNHGTATGKEIFQLSEKIRSSVWDKFNVLLEREVNVI